MKAAIKAGVAFFALVFGAGFALGTVRVLVLEPRIGAHAAQMAELPVMLAVIAVGAPWVLRRMPVDGDMNRLLVGLLAVNLVLAAEWALLGPVRGLTAAEYAQERNPFDAAVFYAALGFACLWPWLHGRRHAALLGAGSFVGLALAFLALAYGEDMDQARARVAGAPVARTACGPIEYSETGRGPAVLFVHGAGGGWDQGIGVAREIATRGYRVVSVSRFGYLRTPLPQHADAAAQADAHACLLDALGIGRAAIVGVSAGGPSSLQFALRHPQRTSGLFLLVPLAWQPDPPAPPSPVARFVYERVLASDFLYWLMIRAAPATMTRAVLATPPAVVRAAPPAEQRRAATLLEDILPVSARREGLRNDAAVAAMLRRYDLEHIEAPTRIVSLRDDLYGTFDMSLYTARNIPDASLVQYPHGGHVWIGHHGEVLEELARFLAGLPREAP